MSEDHYSGVLTKEPIQVPLVDTGFKEVAIKFGKLGAGNVRLSGSV
jgi:hypothetical protein